MPKWSRERINQLARDRHEVLTRAQTVRLLKDREAVRQAIAHALDDELRREQEREENVRRKLATIKKPPSPGSPEYEQLFRKLLEEEHVREGLE